MVAATATFIGAMFVAKFPKNGAGHRCVSGAQRLTRPAVALSNIQYSSDAVDMAKSVGGHSIKGVREY